MPELPSSVRIREVGPRDGFQNEPEVIPTAEKIRLICQGAACSDLAKNGSNGTMIPKPSMLMKMTAISDGAAHGDGGDASRGALSDMGG